LSVSFNHSQPIKMINGDALSGMVQINLFSSYRRNVLQFTFNLVFCLLTCSQVRPECPRNPLSNTICSQDHVYIDSNQKSQQAGMCGTGDTCVCGSDFTGKACELCTQAGASNLFMNSWIYLAKTCWSANTQGTLHVEITWSPWNCSAGVGCSPSSVFTTANVPRILFYSSYDNSFSQAVLQSHTASAFGSAGVGSSDRPCFGTNAVYKESINCNTAEVSNLNSSSFGGLHLFFPFALSLPFNQHNCAHPVNLAFLSTVVIMNGNVFCRLEGSG
jgi:hypothetical protein